MNSLLGFEKELIKIDENFLREKNNYLQNRVNRENNNVTTQNRIQNEITRLRKLSKNLRNSTYAGTELDLTRANEINRQLKKLQRTYNEKRKAITMEPLTNRQLMIEAISKRNQNILNKLQKKHQYYNCLTLPFSYSIRPKIDNLTKLTYGSGKDDYIQFGESPKNVRVIKIWFENRKYNLFASYNTKTKESLLLVCDIRSIPRLSSNDNIILEKIRDSKRYENVINLIKNDLDWTQLKLYNRASANIIRLNIIRQKIPILSEFEIKKNN